MIQYPIVYDRFETEFKGLGLAVLENAQNVKIKEVVNGEYTLSFLLPRNDEKWQYILDENFVRVDGQNFRIRAFDEIRDNTGKLISNVQCEHVWYDANDCKHIPMVELVGVTPYYVLQQAFEGTRFTIGTVEVTKLTDIFLSKTNPTQMVSKLIENVEGELVRDNWTVSLLKKRGADKGVQFRIGKNISTIKKNTDASGVITRLYPYGKDSLDISSVNDGKAYIDSPLLTQYDRAKVNYIDYKDMEDPTAIKTKALEEFSTSEKDGIDKPKVTYSCEVIELKKLKEYGEFESFQLGDVIKIIDEGIATDTRQRLVEYEYYPFEPKRSTVVLVNYDINAYRINNFGGLMSGLIDYSSKFDKVITNKGEINAAWLENIKSKLATEITQGLLRKTVIHDYGDIWVDDLENPTKAMAIVNGMFAIANSKKVNGDWNWRSFGTADGFTADEIVAGILKGIKIQQISDSGAISAEMYKDTLGGKLKIYDSNGSINVEIGVENTATNPNGVTENVGGTIALYNDSLSKRRVEMSISRDYDSGFFNLRNGASYVTVALAASKNGADGGAILVRDMSGNWTQMSATSISVQGYAVATQKYVNDAIAYHLATAPHSAPYVPPSEPTP